MAKRQDIRQSDVGDIYINPTTGDFQITQSDNQHVGDILESINGDYKEFPLIGVNFFQFSNSSGQNQNLERIIRTQLTADAYDIQKIVVPLMVTDLSSLTIYANEPNV